MLLRGKNALVTGSTGFLGSSISLALASAGAFVFMTGRDRPGLEQLLQRVTEAGGQGKVVISDLNNQEGLTSLVQILKRETRDKGLHILVNNAHPTSLPGDTQRREESIRDSLAIAVHVISYLTEELSPQMVEAVGQSGDASVINIASMYGTVAPPPELYQDNPFKSEPWYGAAKASMIQLSRYYASFLGSEGIRVNSISPGPFPKTELKEKFPEFIERLTDKVPLGRVGKPEELAQCCVFLASTMSSFVSGHNLAVDGGWTAR